MRRLILGIVISALVPGLALAQTARDSWDNLKQLRVGQKIQVVDMNLKSLKGTFIAVTEEAISFRVKKDDLTAPREEVMRVTLQNPKRKRNLVLGVVVGAVGGLLAGGAIASSAGWYDAGASGAGTIGLPVALAAAGAGVGAAVTSGLGHRTIYGAKKLADKIR